MMNMVNMPAEHQHVNAVIVTMLAMLTAQPLVQPNRAESMTVESCYVVSVLGQRIALLHEPEST